MKQLKRLILFVHSIFLSHSSLAQTASQSWDNIKNNALPLVDASFQNEFGSPYRQPLSDYGWEDGLQISPDGLNLYALYSPMDLLSYTTFFTSHLQLPICSLFGNTDFGRSYAGTYGMDMATNYFNCDSFPNIDILYAHRNSVSDSFTTWQLSGIARPGLQEGGPAPLYAESNSNNVDLFLFSGNGDLWTIANTTANPTGISGATRIPVPINPDSNEFNADNGFLARINGDTIILIYEQYTDASLRTFMYSISNDLGLSWNAPQAITTITNSLGHIEHPCLYKDVNNQWWLYYSIDYSSIVRSQLMIAGNWDSWNTPETIITKGNASSIGEPTVTQNGDISFSLGYSNAGLNDTADVYDLDPWFLPHVSNTTGIENNTVDKLSCIVFPNPVSDNISITFNLSGDGIVSVQLVDCIGKQYIVQSGVKFSAGIHTLEYSLQSLSTGLYNVVIKTNSNVISKRIVKG